MGDHRMSRRDLLLNIISTLLVVLFFYAAMNKLLDYDRSKRAMLNQVFPRAVALVLVWLVPAVELGITGLLLYKPYRALGLYASALLLLLFSLYIAITMSGVFGRIPCNCGGILSHMSYWTHLLFNLFFIVMAVLGIALEKQWRSIHRWLDFLRRKGGQSKSGN